MKRNSWTFGFLLAFLMLHFTACGQEPKQEPEKKKKSEAEAITEGHEIVVKVNGFSGPEAYLAYHYGDKQYISDTMATEADGSVRFTGEENLERGIYLFVMPPANNYFEFIVANDQTFTLETDTSDFVQNMKTKGSLENKVFYDDLQFLANQRTAANELNEKLGSLKEGDAEYDEIKEKLTRIDTEVKAYRSDLMEAYPDLLYGKILSTMKDPDVPDAPLDENGVKDSLFPFYYYRTHFLDGVDYEDEGLLRTPVYLSKVNRYMDDLTVKHPDSIIVSTHYLIDKTVNNDEMFKHTVVTLLNKYANSKIMGMDAVYVDLVESYYMSGKAWWADSASIAKMAERAIAISPTLIGRKAPNMNMQDLNGKYVNMHQVEAAYTILYFWDYDCGHCKTVTPKVVDLYNKYKDKDIMLYGVSINGDLEEWKKKVGEYGLEGIQVQDHYRRTGFDKMYDLRSTPRILLLDDEKKIIAKYISVDTLDELIQQIQQKKLEKELEKN